MEQFSLTSSVFVAKIGKPPDIAQSHRHGDAGEQEVQFVPPLTSLVLRILIKGVNFCNKMKSNQLNQYFSSKNETAKKFIPPCLVDDVDVRELVGVPGLELDEVVVLLVVRHGLRVLEGHVLPGEIKSLNVYLLLFCRL